MKKINPNPVLDLFDPDCELTDIRLDILEKEMAKELRFMREVGGKFNDILTAYGEKSMDIGFLMGIAIGQTYILPDEKSKKVIEDMRKLVTGRLPKEAQTLKCNP